MLSHIITNSLWWYIMRTPMYNCFMRKTEYLIEWKEKLVRDGLQKQYQINRTDPFSTTMLSYQQNNNTETKFITMPGHALTYDASRRNSFSSRPMYPMEDCGARNWYYNNGCGISIESSNNSPKDDNSHIVLFSPHRPNPRQLNQLENMSSATTVHDDGIDLSRYHFPTPTTKQS
ncbi:hypothetical protein GGI12_002019 [Dipsacomyces acuminosporus]|nr:hypothetical protein GGI12_002019 [Dipsacomyces acuminosporus]